jgi:hypothetical protein
MTLSYWMYYTQIDVMKFVLPEKLLLSTANKKKDLDPFFVPLRIGYFLFN